MSSSRLDPNYEDDDIFYTEYIVDDHKRSKEGSTTLPGGRDQTVSSVDSKCPSRLTDSPSDFSPRKVEPRQAFRFFKSKNFRDEASTESERLMRRNVARDRWAPGRNLFSKGRGSASKPKERIASTPFNHRRVPLPQIDLSSIKGQGVKAPNKQMDPMANDDNNVITLSDDDRCEGEIQSPKHETEKLISYQDHSVNIDDYRTLDDGEFLNDNIIDFYLRYLLHQMDPADKTDVHIFSSHFYSKLKSGLKRRPKGKDSSPSKPYATKAFEGVQKWTKKVDLFKKRLVVIPICEEFHWFVVIICNPGLINSTSEEQILKGNPYFITFDSLGGSHTSVIRNLRSYLRHEYHAKREEHITFGPKSMHEKEADVPMQTNTSDCGLYLLHYIELVFRNPGAFYWHHKVKNLKKWFKAREIKYKRFEIAELIKTLSEQQHPELLLPPLAIAKRPPTTPGSRRSAQTTPSPSPEQNEATNGVEKDSKGSNDSEQSSSASLYLLAEPGHENPEAEGEDRSKEDQSRAISASTAPPGGELPSTDDEGGPHASTPPPPPPGARSSSASLSTTPGIDGQKSELADPTDSAIPSQEASESVMNLESPFEQEEQEESSVSSPKPKQQRSRSTRNKSKKSKLGVNRDTKCLTRHQDKKVPSMFAKTVLESLGHLQKTSSVNGTSSLEGDKATRLPDSLRSSSTPSEAADRQSDTETSAESESAEEEQEERRKRSSKKRKKKEKKKEKKRRKESRKRVALVLEEIEEDGEENRLSDEVRTPTLFDSPLPEWKYSSKKKKKKRKKERSSRHSRAEEDVSTFQDECDSDDDDFVPEASKEQSAAASRGSSKKRRASSSLKKTPLDIQIVKHRHSSSSKKKK